RHRFHRFSQITRISRIIFFRVNQCNLWRSPLNNFSAITISIFVAMNVSKCIAELLMQHDCVIVPGFGAIAAEMKSASIHPAQHSFQPPTKDFSFDSSIADNDGALIEMISRKETSSKDFATRTVRDFVDEIKNSLNEKGAYELK